MSMEFDSFVLTAAVADLTEEPAAREHADAVEFRMDLADEPLSALEAYDGELPILATNRPAWKAGRRRRGPSRGARRGDQDRRRRRDRRRTRVVSLRRRRRRPRDGSRARRCGRRVRPRFRGDARRDRDDRDAHRRLRVRRRRKTRSDGRDARGHARGVGRDAPAQLRRGDGRDHGDGRSGQSHACGRPVYGSKIGYAPVDPAEATAPASTTSRRCRGWFPNSSERVAGSADGRPGRRPQ